MGFFKRKKGKAKDDGSQISSTRDSVAANLSKSYSSVSNREYNDSTPPTPVREATLESVPLLVQDLEDATKTSSENAARSLRLLFALSEHSSSTANRIQMVRMHDAKLVPVLLDFLKKSERGSSDQYLVLLVLNNVSIPTENKRVSMQFSSVLSAMRTRRLANLYLNSLSHWSVMGPKISVNCSVRIHLAILWQSF